VNEKKATDGTYVVLQITNETGSEELPILATVGTWQAHRPEEALRKATAEKELTGKFVAIPARSWRVFDVQPTTVVTVKAVE
jgi:hypothetical protein